MSNTVKMPELCKLHFSSLLNHLSYTSSVCARARSLCLFISHLVQSNAFFYPEFAHFLAAVFLRLGNPEILFDFV